MIIIHHYNTCNSNYPEKIKDENPVTEIDLGNGTIIYQCVDCGAYKAKLDDSDFIVCYNCNERFYAEWEYLGYTHDDLEDSIYECVCPNCNKISIKLL